ncbi:MAG: hypothetical protein Edafosvirus45_6 [Edafosvirus sp.]|uniref:Uncharacterized protein n=1 Tax=Edafosvirus sp. TaxID=2487765 RepID=A0A3G4ZVH9_9VIRU|nr:MAG: hypothetical protein Edafosvirus45_6 [Edafosvirus sp.]
MNITNTSILEKSKNLAEQPKRRGRPRKNQNLDSKIDKIKEKKKQIPLENENKEIILQLPISLNDISTKIQIKKKRYF